MAEKKTLIIVESPAKAKTINKYLGDGFVVRASNGHVIDLPKSQIGIDLTNFKPKYEILADKIDLVKGLVDAARSSNQILLATDPDREGEAIACHLNSQFKNINVPIKRIEFHEITKQGIKNGISKPRELDLNLFDAQQARRSIDRIVGYMVSPFLTRFFSENVSAGRVQSVALRLIVDRDKEIDEFVAEEYWNIHATLAKDSNLKTSFCAKLAAKITKKEDADKIQKELESDTFKATEVLEAEKSKKPFPPLITSSLAKAGAKYKFPAAKTMKIAQTLYESGLITYMRTDSFRVSPEAIDDCRNLIQSKGWDIPAKPNVYANKGAAQDAHEAIRPTDVTKEPSSLSLTDDEKKVYKLIWEAFVTSQMKPALFDTVNVTITSSSKHILKASGKVMKYEGWLALAGHDDSDVNLPLLKVNDAVLLVPPKVETEQKFTQPPPRLNEKTLIEILDKKGIGRPSTYASITGKIFERKYVTREGDVFYSTDLGRKIIDVLSKSFKFVEYEYTADMEKQLDLIAAGDLPYLQMMTDFYKPFTEQLKKADNTPDYGFVCNKCFSKMRLRSGKFGHFMACSEYPNCKVTFSVEMVNGKPVRIEKKSAKTENTVKTKCPQCGLPQKRIEGQYGPFLACTGYPACKHTQKLDDSKKSKQKEDIF